MHFSYMCIIGAKAKKIGDDHSRRGYKFIWNDPLMKLQLHNWIFIELYIYIYIGVCVDLKMIFIPMTSEGIINEPVMNSQLFFSSSYILELMVRSRSIFLSFSNTYVCQIVESCTSFIYERSESFIYERKKKLFCLKRYSKKNFLRGLLGP